MILDSQILLWSYCIFNYEVVSSLMIELVIVLGTEKVAWSLQ